MGIFFNLVQYMGRMLGKKGDRVTIDQNGDPVPPPPAKQPSEGHYIAMNFTPNNFDDTPSSLIRRGYAAPAVDDIVNNELAERFHNSPNLKGALIWYYWAELETSEGVYDFSMIQADLDTCAHYGRRLVVGILDKTFRNNHFQPLPAYMSDYSFPLPQELDTNGVYDGWARCALRWHPVVVTRFTALINAMQTTFDSSPYYEGFGLEESAPSFTVGATNAPWVNGKHEGAAYYPYFGPGKHGPMGDGIAGNIPSLPWGAPDAVQYSAQRYCDMYFDLAKNTKATRTTSRFFMPVNYILYGQTKNGPMVDLFKRLAAEEAVHVAIGGPDWFPSFAYTTGKQAGPAVDPPLGYTSAGVAGVVLPRHKQAFDMGLPIYGSFQFNGHDTGPNGVKRAPNTAFTPNQDPIEFTMEQMFIHATKLISETGHSIEQPGSGNPYGMRVRYLFWTNCKDRLFQFDPHDKAVIAANPTWFGIGLRENWD